MKLPVCIYVWDGHAMLPTLHYERLAQHFFTVGQAYRMAPGEVGSRSSKRTLLQNDKMWAMLTEISEQVEHCGHHYTPDEWKVLLMHACGHEQKLLPALDEKTIVPYGGRSSQMTIAQMNELIEYMTWWGEDHGVRFADQGNYDVDRR